MTSLMFASQSGDLACVEALVKAKADVLAKDKVHVSEKLFVFVAFVILLCLE